MREMLQLARKITRYFVSLVLIIVINFTLPRLMPGDPVKNLIGEDVYVSEEVMEQMKAELGLNLPLSEQFTSYLSNLLHLDLGYSYHLHAPVAEILLDKMSWTLIFCEGISGYRDFAWMFSRSPCRMETGKKNESFYRFYFCGALLYPTLLSCPPDPLYLFF